MRHTPRILALALLVLFGIGCGERSTLDAPARVLWVTRWDYASEADVQRIVADAEQAGFDELLFQVRGNATCFFESSLEPWAEQFGFESPGFDPLAVALEAAHERGLSLHAWVNVVPAWWGDAPPTAENHVVNLHPEWLWYAQDGARQPFTERFYVSLNPCLPEVRAHVTAVLSELLERYAVDGLHLDYIRFPNELFDGEEGADYPRDARTLALFEADEHAQPDEQPERWNEWRSEQVTALVRDLRAAQRRLRPAAILSAAVGPDPEAARRRFQDWPRWIDEGLLDALFPMNYTADRELFRKRCEEWEQHAARVRVVMGLHAESAAPEVVLERAEASLERFGGYALFGYLSLWDSTNDVIDVQTEARSQERARLRADLLPLDE